MHTLLHRSRLRVAAAALALGATAAVVQAAPTAATPASTSAAAGTTAVSSLPCGFGYWQQSYRNCSRMYNVRVEAPAYDSNTGHTSSYYYCLKPGTARVPLALWGQWVHNVYVKATLSPC